MKFLCLPGGYCSATSFKAQIAPVVNSLAAKGDIEFHYTQGTIETAIPPDFQGFFGPPPNFTFTKPDGAKMGLVNLRDFPKRNTPEEAIRAAIEISDHPTYSYITQVMDRLVDLIDTEGDIDGVIGYSEGAGIAASLLIEETRRERELGRQPRLKCAILFSGWPPIHPVTGKIVVADDFDQEPITIPTCHVIGASDPFLDGAIALYNMCDPDTADLFDHGGGHVLPRSKHIIDELTPIIREMIASVA